MYEGSYNSIFESRIGGNGLGIELLYGVNDDYFFCCTGETYILTMDDGGNHLPLIRATIPVPVM